MTIMKEKIYAFFITVFIVVLMNCVLEYYTTKNDYTITYSQIVSNIQKNVDENIVEIKDKVVTKGSVLVLAKMKNDTLNLYHFERGYFTLCYRYDVFEHIEDREILIRNKFEEFRLDIDGYSKIAINPATFKKSMSWSDFIAKWLMPFVTIIKTMVYIMERRKQNLLENVLT